MRSFQDKFLNGGRSATYWARWLLTSGPSGFAGDGRPGIQASESIQLEERYSLIDICTAYHASACEGILKP